MPGTRPRQKQEFFLGRRSTVPPTPPGMGSRADPVKRSRDAPDCPWAGLRAALQAGGGQASNEAESPRSRPQGRDRVSRFWVSYQRAPLAGGASPKGTEFPPAGAQVLARGAPLQRGRHAWDHEAPKVPAPGQSERSRGHPARPRGSVLRTSLGLLEGPRLSRELGRSHPSLGARALI